MKSAPEQSDQLPNRTKQSLSFAWTSLSLVNKERQQCFYNKHGSYRMAEPIPPLPPAALIDQDGVIACLTLCGLTTDAQRHQIDLCSMQMDRFVCVLCKLIGLNLFVYFTNV